MQLSPDTDFFGQGAGSLDATRLVENLQSKVGLVIDPEDIYRAPTFAKFVETVLKTKSGAADYKTVKVKANGLELSLPVQHFIGGEFVDGLEGKTRPTINPATEEVIVEVAEGGAEDVDKAVASAKVSRSSDVSSFGRISGQTCEMVVGRAKLGKPDNSREKRKTHARRCLSPRLLLFTRPMACLFQEFVGLEGRDCG